MVGGFFQQNSAGTRPLTMRIHMPFDITTKIFPVATYLLSLAPINPQRNTGNASIMRD